MVVLIGRHVGFRQDAVCVGDFSDGLFCFHFKAERIHGNSHYFKLATLRLQFFPRFYVYLSRE